MNTSFEPEKQAIDFNSFGLNDKIMQAIHELGFKVPSPIQERSIPVIMKKKDIIGQAHTGTGKTAAFGLPILNSLKHDDSIECLVLTPTRELAMQVSEQLYMLGKYDNTSVLTIYGGQAYKRQIDRIKTTPDIIVATPGRLLDLINKGYLKKLRPTTVVLDEADEMLDMGFLEPIEEIFSHLDANRQTLFFSATMPKPIQKLAENILKDPILISVTDGQKHTVNENINEMYAIIHEHERDDAVIRLIDSEEVDKVIIFCRTKSEVDRLNTHLVSNGYSAGCLHGDMEQGQRKKMITNFQTGKISILVATDVAARGLDIKDVSHVFNFHIPYEPEAYVHRIGRTGRAGKNGIAITLTTKREFQKLKRFKKIIGGEISHCIIPTLNELRKLSVDKIIKEIKDQKINTFAKEYIQNLTKVIPDDLITEKLMSYVIDQLTIIGPESIGLSSDEIQKVINSKDNERHGNQRRRRPHRGGSNRFRSNNDNKQKRYGNRRYNESSSNKSNSYSSKNSNKHRRKKSS